MESFSIAGWCALHKVSRAFYYKLAKQREAPKSFNVGATKRISGGANAEWLAAREAAPADNEAAVKRIAIAMKAVAGRKAKAKAAA